MSEESIEELAARKAIRNPVLRFFILSVGWLSVALGFIGIFLPLLPTTPFLLLSAACFLRTSPRFYQWLISHPRFGPYVVHYLNGNGIPLRAKIYTLLLMWSTMLFSAFILLDVPIVKITLPTIGLLVSIYILRLPTLEVDKPPRH